MLLLPLLAASLQALEATVLKEQSPFGSGLATSPVSTRLQPQTRACQTINLGVK